MIFLKQSTASQEVLLGPFVDSTDGVTAETALSIANTDIKIWKAGATTLANKNSGGATHISGGVYYAVLDATDTNTLGSGSIIVAMSGALVVKQDFVVLSANVYDSLIGGGDVLDVELTAAGIDAMHDEVIENSKTFRQMVRLMYAALCNKVTGLGTTSVAFRDDADTKNRIDATVDALGNRSAVTKDGT